MFQPRKTIFATLVLFLSLSSATGYGLDEEKSRSLRTRDILSFPFKLLGTVLREIREHSVALLEDEKTKEISIHRIGDQVEGYRLVRVRRGEADFLKDGERMTLHLPGGDPPTLVTIVSETERIVNVAAWNEKFGDLNQAVQLGVALPHIEKGKITGLKIHRLHDGALAKAAGIKEGDIITSVNGMKPTSLRGAMEIYHTLRREPKITVEVKRRNSTTQYTYWRTPSF